MWVCSHEKCGRIISLGIYCAEHEAADRQQKAAAPPAKVFTGGKLRNTWDKWYSLAVWKRLRQIAFHIEENIICGYIERGERCRKPSEEIHHKIPHRGDWNLFTDLKNLQGMCAHHHRVISMREQNEERKKNGEGF